MEYKLSAYKHVAQANFLVSVNTLTSVDDTSFKTKVDLTNFFNFGEARENAKKALDQRLIPRTER